MLCQVAVSQDLRQTIRVDPRRGATSRSSSREGHTRDSRAITKDCSRLCPCGHIPEDDRTAPLRAFPAPHPARQNRPVRSEREGIDLGDPRNPIFLGCVTTRVLRFDQLAPQYTGRDVPQLQSLGMVAAAARARQHRRGRAERQRGDRTVVQDQPLLRWAGL
eukprot:3174416-Rhodomonas_salina.1